MWIELQKTDDQTVRLRADRILSVAQAYFCKGVPVSHVYMVGMRTPHSVLGTAEEVTARVDETLQGQN